MSFKMKSKVELNDDPEMEVITKKLSKDLRESAKNLTPHEARFLVDNYYTMQRDRIRGNNRYTKMLEGNEPASVIEHMGKQALVLEQLIGVSLDVYSANHPVGQWLRSNRGIGPVISAGLLAHVNIEKTPWPGSLWSFAGLNPKMVWKKGQIRPYNARLKTLCWKIGESFVKTKGHEEAHYGRLYDNRKVYETNMNERGMYAAQAHEILDKFNYEDPTAVATLKSGKLLPAIIHARCKRFAVKVFLAHYHEALYTWRYRTAAPRPWVLDHMLNHDKIPPFVPLPWADPSW